MKPLVIELFAGRFGWGKGFVAQGWRCIGFDIVHEEWHKPVPPGCELVLQDVLTLHGSQFKDAAAIVASPPCQAYSYRAMPWKLAKALPPPSNELFDACFRLQREANSCEWCAGTGRTPLYVDSVIRHRDVRTCGSCAGSGVARNIPMVVENVKGAQPWVGRAKANYGSFYLWGDVENIGGRIVARGPIRFGQPSVKAATRRLKHNPDGTDHPSGSWFAIADSKNRGARDVANKQPVWFNDDKRTKCGGDWFGAGADCSLMRKQSSRSPRRAAASAAIAEIPFDLASHIARCFLA